MATTNRMYIAPGADHLSEVQAWNVDTGKKVWSHHFAKSPNWGPIMTTGGGLVFSGGTNDRMFRAFDASNGEVLWEFPTNSGIYAPPASFIDRRHAVHRCGLRLGTGRALDAVTHRRRLAGEFPGSSGRRRHLGVRDQADDAGEAPLRT